MVQDAQPQEGTLLFGMRIVWLLIDRIQCKSVVTDTKRNETY